MLSFSTSKRAELIEIVAFTIFYYLLPIGLLAAGWLPFSSRHVIIFFLGLILVAYAIEKGVSAHDLGLRKDNLKEALIYNVGFSIFAIVVALIGFYTGILTKVAYDGTWLFLVYYILISAPLQEFIFRSLMFYELGLFFRHQASKIIVSALIFAFAHAMYHSWQVFWGTLFMGLVLGIIYVKKPNFWGVAVAHALIGIVSVFLGVV